MKERSIPLPHDPENGQNWLTALGEQMAWEEAQRQNRRGRPMPISQDQAGNWLNILGEKRGLIWDLRRAEQRQKELQTLTQQFFARVDRQRLQRYYQERARAEEAVAQFTLLLQLGAILAARFNLPQLIEMLEKSWQKNPVDSYQKIQKILPNFDNIKKF